MRPLPATIERATGALPGGAFALALLRHRALLAEMTRREIVDRYAGQALGAAWAVAHPLILIVVHVFVFAVVFRAKIGDGSGWDGDYTAYILSGLIPWLAFQEAMAKSTVSVVGHVNLVKQVVFPVELLPAKAVLSTLASQAVATAVLLVYASAAHGAPPLTWLFLPALVFFGTLLALGLGLLLAAAGVYVRDLKDVVQVLCVVGVYLVPVAYLPDWAPPAFRPFLVANPVSHMIWCYQDALFFGRAAHPGSWVVFPLAALLAWRLGCAAFARLSPHFGSAL